MGENAPYHRALFVYICQIPDDALEEKLLAMPKLRYLLLGEKDEIDVAAIRVTLSKQCGNTKDAFHM